MKDTMVVIILGVIMVLNLADVVTDINLGVPTWHIIEESMIVLAAGLTVTYLVIEMSSARRQYSELIHQQFETWKLTVSEQQVAMLLLKGLSFKEIAMLRDTREKTVRQQASTIYSKSGVDGRHAFAAWFLEDFLAPEPRASSDRRVLPPNSTVHRESPGSASRKAHSLCQKRGSDYIAP